MTAASRHGQLSHNVLPHLTGGLRVEVTSLYCREAGNVLLTVSEMTSVTRRQVMRRGWRLGGHRGGQVTWSREGGPPVNLCVGGAGAEVT